MANGGGGVEAASESTSMVLSSKVIKDYWDYYPNRYLPIVRMEAIVSASVVAEGELAKNRRRSI